MSVIATAVKHLLAAGVTGDALVAAIADMENCAPTQGRDATAARRRERDAVYQAAKRAQKAVKARRQILPTSADDADAPPNDIYSNPPQLSPEASPLPRVARSSARKAQPSRLQADWKPANFADDTVARSVVDRRGRDWARAALESFRNWAANADDRNGIGRKLDWQAAWANWIIKQDKDDGRSGSGNGRMGGDRVGGDRTLGAMQDFVAGGAVHQH